jgi:hypothetical protein
MLTIDGATFSITPTKSGNPYASNASDAIAAQSWITSTGTKNRKRRDGWRASGPA